MSKKLLSSALFLILLSLLSVEVSAHTLESGDAFGAVMHIDPNDEPVAESPSTIIFDIKSKDDDFVLSKCICNVHILQNNKELTTLPLQILDPKSPNTGTVSYTFPTTGDYSLKLEG